MLSVMTMFTAASAQDSDLSTLTDAIYVESATIPAGSQQTLSVKMKNSIEVQTIQFDLYLPEGLSFVANDDDELMTASKARIKKFDYFNSSVQADGALRLLAQATTTNIAVGDGEIANVIVKADASMTQGDYPIAVKAILLVSKDNTSKKVDEVKTTLTIGAPADTRTILDETSTTAPKAATGVDIRVKRTIKAGEWSTICLPFAMTATQIEAAFPGMTVQLGDFNDYEFDDAEGAISVKFANATAIAANHPYIIKVSEGVTEFTVDGVDIDPKEAVVDFDTSRRKNQPRQMVGTYVANTVLEWGTLFLSSNQFWYSVGNTKMKAFRAYFNFYDLLPDFEDNYQSRNISMTFDDVTGINDTNRETTTNNSYYDLQGRRIDNSQLKKGLYIRNGKKEIIK